MIEFRQKRNLEQDLMPEALEYLDKKGIEYTIIAPNKADEASRKNSKALVLMYFKLNTSGYYEIQIKDKECYRYNRKLLEVYCGMRITDVNEKERTITAEADHKGVVLSVIEVIALKLLTINATLNIVVKKK